MTNEVIIRPVRHNPARRSSPGAYFSDTSAAYLEDVLQAESDARHIRWRELLNARRDKFDVPPFENFMLGGFIRNG